MLMQGAVANAAIVELYNSQTIAEDIGEESRKLLSNKIIKDFNEDFESCKGKLARMKRAIELVGLKKVPKNKPFINSANIKHPLLATACINFSARAEFETVKNGEPLHYKIYGQDPTGFWDRMGRRKKAYTNYQLMEEMTWWQAEKKQLFFMCSITGTMFTKTYYDPVKNKKYIRALKYDRMIVNNAVSDLNEPGVRHTEIFYRTPSAMKRLIKNKVFREVDLDKLKLDEKDSKAIEHELLEHHCWMDLDNDDIDEPWIVILHKASGEILRIAPGFELDKVRLDPQSGQILDIEKEKIYTVYRFWHDPEQGFWGIGYGTWLADDNEAVDAMLNQLIDSGTLANYQGGFISSDLRIRKQRYDDQLGMWKSVDADGASLKDGIMPFNYKEPSQVLFNLLVFLIESVNKMTAVTDALTGTANPTDASPNVFNQLIQQGLKVYNSVLRFLMSSVTEETQILDRLNTLYPDPENYIRVVSPSSEELKEMVDPSGSGQIIDLMPGNIKLVPMIDITKSTEAERSIKDQVATTIAIQMEQVAPGTCNMKNILRRLYYNMEIPRPEELVNPDPPPDAPNLPLLKFQSEIDKTAKELGFKDREIVLKEKALILDAIERGHKMQEVSARAIKLLADAESQEGGKNLDQYRLELEKLKLMIDAEVKINKNKIARSEGELAQRPNAELVKQELMKRGWAN